MNLIQELEKEEADRLAAKRAIVTVAAGDRIDIFGGPVS